MKSVVIGGKGGQDEAGIKDFHVAVKQRGVVLNEESADGRCKNAEVCL